MTATVLPVTMVRSESKAGELFDFYLTGDGDLTIVRHGSHITNESTMMVSPATLRKIYSMLKYAYEPEEETPTDDQ